MDFDLFDNCCRNGNLEVLIKLSKLDIKPTFRSLGYALANKHFELTKFLVEKYPNILKPHHLDDAAKYGNLDVVKIMIGQDFDPTGSDIIFKTAQNGHHETVKLLLEDGRADPTYNSNSAIRYAAQNGHAKVVELLMNDPRVNPCDVDSQALKRACQEGHLDVVKLLLKDPNIIPNYIPVHNFNINSAIYIASREGHIDIVKLLLRYPGMYRNCIQLGYVDVLMYHPKTEFYRLDKKTIDILSNFPREVESTILDFIYYFERNPEAKQRALEHKTSNGLKSIKEMSFMTKKLNPFYGRYF